MSLVGMRGVYVPNPVFGQLVVPNGFVVIDAAGERHASVFRVPKSGTVTAIAFRTATVTGSQTLRVSLQTLNATGDPSGTLYGGSAAGTQAAPASNTVYTVTLGTPATVTAGDKVAVVIEFDSTPGNVQIAVVGGSLTRKFPYYMSFNGTAWSKGNFIPCDVMVYDDGTVSMNGAFLYSTFTGTTIGNGSEHGLRFTLPFPARLQGYWFCGGATAAGSDHEVTLYDAASNVIDVEAWDGDFRASTVSGYMEGRLMTAPVLAKDVLYRLTVKQTTANAVVLSRFSVPSTAFWSAHEAASDWNLTARTGAGAWSDFSTSRPMLGLILDQIDDGVSTGGGVYTRAPFTVGL